MSCIECVLDLCEIKTCNGKADFTFPAIAPSDGQYYLNLKYQNAVLSSSTTFVAGENIKFSLDHLNENYCYEGWLEDESGNIVPVVNDATSYSHFKFCTRPTISI